MAESIEGGPAWLRGRAVSFHTMHRMTRTAALTRLLLGLTIAATPTLLAAQQARQTSKPAPVDLATAKPGRDPNQPIDEEYTKKIKEYTTETFFLSPVVDYLPASKTVPTPKAILGDIAGAPGKLPYTKEVYDYMRLLEKSSPRVKVYCIGKTEEGREMIAVAVASEALMAKLEANKADLAKLADPRTIKMDDAAADEIAKRAAPVYYITGTIHSTEAGAPTALMELAYRLAVDDSPYIRNIREHVITLITPVVEVDGRDRVVDLYNYRKANPDKTVPGALYWGKYVAHDNNRDAMGVTLKLTENVLNTYVEQKALVLHDLHESGSYLYDNTIGDGPYNAWIDPILTNEWQMIGWNNVNEMTRLGMPGVFAFGTFDTWSPGYLMFIAATHNGISRLYETFGNGGSADTVERTLSAARDVADLVPAESAAAVREVVAAQQQQLRTDRPHRLAQLHREQPAVSSSATSTRRASGRFSRRGPRGRRRTCCRRRAAPGRAGRAAARPAEAARRDLARDRGVHRAGPGARAGGGAPGAAAARAARGAPAGGGAGGQRGGRRGDAGPATRTPDGSERVPGRQLHHPDGSAVLAHRRRAARLSVLGAERSAEQPVRRHRLDVPGGLRRAGRPRAGSRRCSTRRSSS